MSTEIRSREENGFMVFEKDKLNDLEIKFFNPEYFSKIGFPDAEIKIVNNSDGQEVNSTNLPEPNTSVDSNEQVAEQPEATAETAQENVEGDAAEQPQENVEGDVAEQPQENVEGDVAEQPQENVEGDKVEDNVVDKIKGGYYKNVESLTLPFQYFVYFVQSKTPNGEYPDSSVSPPNSEGETKFTFDSFYDRIKNAFSGNNNTSVDQSKSNPISDQNSASDSNSFGTWVVKIPITTDADASQINEYKKEELKLNQILREFKMEQSNHLIIKGEVFNVGTRFIKIAQTVEEGQPTLETDKTKLLGTKMAKYERLTSTT